MRIVFAVADERTVYEVPVDEESTLQGIDCTTRQSPHGVAPWLRTRSLHIAQGNIHTTHIAHTTINDNDLTMVAVVGLRRKRREVNGQERRDLHTRIA